MGRAVTLGLRAQRKKDLKGLLAVRMDSHGSGDPWAVALVRMALEPLDPMWWRR